MLACVFAFALAAPPPIRGVALGLYSEDSGFSYDPLLREIAAAGANHVELVINLYQQGGASSRLYTHTRFTPPDESVVRAMADAHARGLGVVLLPIVRLEAPRPGEWRGNLVPADRGAWFASYGDVIVHYATLARRGRAAALVIGSELGTLDVDPAPWRRLAQRVRRVFSGTLVYAANWDHVGAVALWDAVDAIGLSFYFPVDQRFSAVRGEIEAIARANAGKPLWLTEVGYLSQRGAAAWPWKEAAREPIDLAEQERCYQRFIAVWDGARALEAVFFWNWYGWGGAGSPGYTPRGKPAARAITHWFGGTAPQDPP